MMVAAGSDLSRVEEVTLEVAREVMAEVEGGVPELEPFVRYTSFATLGMEFNVIMRTQEFTEQDTVVHEFIKRLDERYRREGIEVPTPATVGVLADGSKAVETPEQVPREPGAWAERREYEERR